MKLIVRVNLFLLLLTLLAGCGPVYKRQYAFVPPKTSTGKMCIAQCGSSKQSCQQMCAIKTETCRLRAKQDAVIQFEQYKNDRRHAGESIDKELSYFDHSSSCDTACHCEPAYRECYSACGGEVLQKDVCVAFCDKKQ